MSQYLIDELTNTLKISPERAEKLLELASGDIEKAKQLFIDNMCAIKGHIISDDQKTYGIVLIVLNEMSNPVKVNMSNILFSNNKEILSLNIDTPYSSYYKNFFNLSFRLQLLTNLMNDVNNYLAHSLSNIETQKIYTNASIKDVENIILKILKKILKDHSVEVFLNYELISYAEYHIPEEKEKETTGSKETTDYDETTTEKKDEMITIKCDYKLAPAKGKAAKNLALGDFLYVKINDTSPEAMKITNFLKEKYQGKVPDLRLPIIKIEKNETERLGVFVQITESVRGALLINQEVNVKVYDPKAEAMANAESESNSLFSTSNIYLFVIGIVILLVIIMLIFR